MFKRVLVTASLLPGKGSDRTFLTCARVLSRDYRRRGPEANKRFLMSSRNPQTLETPMNGTKLKTCLLVSERAVKALPIATRVFIGNFATLGPLDSRRVFMTL